jgi:hypothetical protein
MGGPAHRLDGGDHPSPRFCLLPELSPPHGGELVVLRLASVLSGVPLGGDPAAILQAFERGVERARIHLEHVLGDLLNALSDPPPVHRSEGDRLEDEHVQGSLDDVTVFGGGPGHASELSSRT